MENNNTHANKNLLPPWGAGGLFTVLMPVYNTHPANLIQAFYSVYNQQGVTGYEILIVDDGSDKSETLLALEMLGKLERATIIRHETRKGSAAARNTGLKHITTEYIALMDSDDISAPTRFKSQLDYLQQQPVDVLGTNLFGFMDNDIGLSRLFTTGHKQIPDYNKGWMVNQGTVFLRTQAVLSADGYNENIRRAQDIDLWRRMYKIGYVLRNVEEVLYAWRRYS